MLSLQTRDNWAAAQVLITVGAGNDTWTCPATANSAVDAVQDLATWANDAGRPWAGAVLFSWSWGRNTPSGGAKLRLVNSGGPFVYNPNGPAVTLLGMPAMAGQVLVTGTAPAAGTWAPGPTGYLALKLGVLWLKAGGLASAVGAVRPGVPGLAPWVASCRPVVEAQDVARLAGILGAASHPRRAWLRVSNTEAQLPAFTELVTPPGDMAGWRLVALGQVQRQRQGASLWACELAVAGEAV